MSGELTQSIITCNFVYHSLTTIHFVLIHIKFISLTLLLYVFTLCEVIWTGYEGDQLPSLHHRGKNSHQSLYIGRARKIWWPAFVANWHIEGICILSTKSSAIGRQQQHILKPKPNKWGFSGNRVRAKNEQNMDTMGLYFFVNGIRNGSYVCVCDILVINHAFMLVLRDQDCMSRERVLSHFQLFMLQHAPGLPGACWSMKSWK